MIEVNIKAKDWTVCEALEDIERKINSEMLDVIYDGITDEVECDGEHYTATFKRVKVEKKEEEKKEMTAYDKLSQMSCKEFSLFMRSIGVFGDNDFVTEYYEDKIGEIITDAIKNFYTVNVHINVTHHYYLHVKYVDSYYCRECTIVGLNADLEEWHNYFKFENIVKEYEKEILAF